MICETVSQTGRVVVVDEDYEGFGLSGEVAAILMEEGIPARYARVCTQNTIPYARHSARHSALDIARAAW
jgi:pyruvate dehydrogenase E1 component beta subunit